MPDKERAYYLILEGSPAAEVRDRLIVLDKEFRESAHAFQVKYGGIGWVQAFAIVGLAFPSNAEVGVEWRRKEDYWVPNRKTTVGRRIAAEMKNLPPVPDSRLVSHMLGDAYEHWGSGLVQWSQIFQIGDNFILSVPLVCNVVPVGCRELKMSEYWAMKAAAEAVKEAKNAEVAA